MGCEICGRNSCMRSFHSLDAQERHDNPEIEVEELNSEIDKLETINAELLEACERFVESSHCKNGCKPDDMTCDTMFAKQAISKAKGELI